MTHGENCRGTAAPGVSGPLGGAAAPKGAQGTRTDGQQSREAKGLQRPRGDCGETPKLGRLHSTLASGAQEDSARQAFTNVRNAPSGDSICNVRDPSSRFSLGPSSNTPPSRGEQTAISRGILGLPLKCCVCQDSELRRLRQTDFPLDLGGRRGWTEPRGQAKLAAKSVTVIVKCMTSNQDCQDGLLHLEN